MRTDVSPQTVRLEDYKAPDYWIDSVWLGFDLEPTKTTVRSRIDVRRSVNARANAPLILDGEAIELVSIKIDGKRVAEENYSIDGDKLTINGVPEAFILEITTNCNPEGNTALSGLYISKGMFCTQCEAEGFRRITYFLDRPDVLAKYTVRVEADRDSYPVLLSNGNLIASGEAAGDRHFVEWQDPHPKPAYLFALVAGDLVAVEDSFTTRSGREVALKVFVQSQNADKCAYTLDSLKRSMRWDEETFGREYDLDIFMIVAVDHFNFGAMENKGLNIFNSAYVLASPDTATDMDYEAIESIVAHEYFHNWSGNRVTCRDWFQLCLKEGFTVFRDQEFSADMRSRPVQRIKDVRRLWAGQFPEDAGPLAHPPRPDHYITIDNFYTATVYEKGAELVRMIKKLLGPEDFRKASDLYFSRHDGQAATVEDFVGAMEDGSGVDLKQFRRWYSDAGTPTLKVSLSAQGDGEYTLWLEQSTAPTPGQPDKPARHMPIDLALIDRETGKKIYDDIIELKEDKRRVDIQPLGYEPASAHKTSVVASVLRGFSAPVRLDQQLSVEDRLVILEHESDLFNRWASADRLWKDLCLAFADAAKPFVDREKALVQFANALEASLQTAGDNNAFAAELLKAPTEAEIAQEASVIDPGKIAGARAHVRAFVGNSLVDFITESRDALASSAAYSPDAAQAGARALRNAGLGLLVAAGKFENAEDQARTATNMTDAAASLSILAASNAPGRDALLNTFYEKWKDNALVVNKWLGWRAMQPGDGALDAIKALFDHPAFDIKTPNKVRAVLGVFAHYNLGAFHRPDGAGYDFLADTLLIIDPINPQLAARMTTSLETWRRLEPGRKQIAEKALRRIAETKNISPNIYEMATRLLSE